MGNKKSILLCSGSISCKSDLEHNAEFFYIFFLPSKGYPLEFSSYLLLEFCKFSAFLTVCGLTIEKQYLCNNPKEVKDVQPQL